MAITLNSYNEILGKLIRKMIADTPVNDINRGSVLLTLLEAVASQDFENSTNILSVLESLSIDALKNSDLDQRAADYGLTRNSATRATGFVNISDSSITKKSTSLYAMKQPPIAGSTVVYVNNAGDWNQSGGYIYIGRGTQQFEGPIEYSSIIDNGSFYTINLSSAVQNDHLISDSVVDAQGTIDRIIPSGTVVKIPSNSQNPEILYSTLRDAILPAGEDSISNVSILANQVGSSSNTGINTIVQFSSLPFSSATVTNYTALIDGKDTESDDELRERIKSYTSTLARGTREAILTSIIGVSDSSDGKQVSSATITEPASVGEPSIVYIDDGSGFQPSFSGQSVDVILASATGGEEFLQLANFPLPRPQVVNLADGPYSLVDQSTFSVLIDDKEEEITFESSQFSNIASATLQEVVNAINDQSETFKCRLTDSSTRLLIYPVSHDVEFIQVKENYSTSQESYANTYLKFPTNKYSYITLYKNNQLLSEKESSATLRTTAQSNWGITSSSQSGLIIEVDGTPAQSRGFDELDFGGQTFTTLTVSDWVSVINKKFAGIRATATSSDQIEISSNLIGPESSIRIVGGDYSSLMFSGMDIYAEGKNSDFSLNRQTGNVQIKTTILAGDSITAGSSDTKGSIVSASSTGSFDLTADAYGRSAELILIADGNNTTYRSEVNAVIGTTVTITALPATGTKTQMQIMSNTKTLFANAQIGDYVFLTYRGSGSGWLSIENCGLYKISSKGGHVAAGVDTWICVSNQGATSSSTLTIQSSDDIKVFSADSYPQIWKSSYLAQPGSATIKSIADSIKSNTENIKTSIYKTSYIKLTSSTENDGSIATPVSIGSMTNVFTSGVGAELGNQSNIANKTTQKDLISYFKMSEPSSQYVYLNRSTYSDLNTKLYGSLSVTNPSTTTSETLYVKKSNDYNDNNLIISNSISYDDIVNITSGSNKSHFRSIKNTGSYLTGVQFIQTQVDIPKTIFDYSEYDSINLLKPLSISADDSIVFILDGDSVNKTINVNFWRTGKVFYNNNFTATNNEFSALDADNESNISFSNLEIWSKTNTNTEFKDYAVWFRSRNWYTSSASGSAAALIIRAKEYGPSGDNYSFSIEYPSLPDQDPQVKHVNSPDGTVCSYTFASDSEISTGVTGGTQFSVTKNSSTATLKFKQAYVDFSSLNPAGGDIISITDPGISSSNRGVFRINSFNVANRTIDITNANAIATSLGTPEKYIVSNIKEDKVGTHARFSITCTAADPASSSNKVGSGDYLIFKDSQDRSICFYYTIGGAGYPPALNPSPYISIPIDISTSDSASQIATKTSAAINLYSDFLASASGVTITFENKFNKLYSIDTITWGNPVNSTYTHLNTGFVLSITQPGESNDTLGGKYFKIYDTNGSVAVWFSVYGETEPSHGADRSIQVVISPGANLSTVATAIKDAVDYDSQFAATWSSPTLTITNTYNGDLSSGDAGTSTFTISNTTGTDPGYETVTSAPGIRIFPLTSNDCQSIADFINSNSSVITASTVSSLESNKFIKSTKQESLSVSHGHTAGDSSIKLFDGESFIKTFQNENPHFTLKKSLVLQGQSPYYNMMTCKNPDTEDLGEFFKLIPKTIKNIRHHLSHKALSQLPIVADIDISDKFRKIQVKSKKLGTSGSVEVVGGRANIGEFSIFGDGEKLNNTLKTKVSAYPSTINTGDIVKVYNEKPAKRYSRLSATDTVTVQSYANGDCDYIFNKKEINSYDFIKWTVTDVTSQYGSTYGSAFRYIYQWQHNDAGKNIIIQSKTNGLDLLSPAKRKSNGSSNPLALELFNVVSGSSNDKLTFNISVNDVPAQGDYFVFQNSKIRSTFSTSSITSGAISIYASDTQDWNTPGGSIYIERGTSSQEGPLEYSYISHDLPNNRYIISLSPSVSVASNHPELCSIEQTCKVAIWFDINANGASPSSTEYNNSDIKIKVSVNSTDTPNDIVLKIKNALNANLNFKDAYSIDDGSSISLEKVKPGDVLGVWPNNPTSNEIFSFWPTLWSQSTGSEKISNYPIVKVDAANRYMHVVNPQCDNIVNYTFSSKNGNVQVFPSMSIRWRFKTNNYIKIKTITKNGSSATVITEADHGFLTGSGNYNIYITDASDSSLNGAKIVTKILSPSSFELDTVYFSLSGSVQAGSSTVSNISSTANVSVGMFVSGTGIPANTTVVSKTSNSIVMSNAATATGSSVVFTSTPDGTYYGGIVAKSQSFVSLGSTIAGSSTVSSVSSIAFVNVGMFVSGTGIPANTTVVSKTSNSIVMSNAATATGTGITLTFTSEQALSNFTRLKIEKIGFNNLARISYVVQENGVGSLRPLFKTFGVAVDDFVKISGSSFDSVNNGLFRVLAVSDEYVIIENPNCKEQINRFKKFNNKSISTTWQANSTQITGIAGSFKYVAIGDWVKKKEDEDYHLIQVINFDTGNSETATIAYLGSPYKGDDSISEGVAINQSLDSNSGINQGVLLENVDDVIFYCADSVLIGDSLVIENISSSSWFEASNCGVFTIKDFGTDSTTKAQYIRVYNPDAINQTSVSLNLKPDGMYVLENENYKYESVRKVKHTAVSELNSNQRFLYMVPDHQSDKISSVYGTKVKSLGKLDFEVGASSGIDGYSYYTGLLQTVQRIIDGYEPDSTTYPGRRAVGSLIEVLPPLIRSIRVSLDITTKEGVNLTEISNDIKSVIINYVNSLGVGKDVVHSEIIARIMAINGIDAATFTYPAASEERTAISDNEKAFISPDSISLA